MRKAGLEGDSVNLVLIIIGRGPPFAAPEQSTA